MTTTAICKTIEMAKLHEQKHGVLKRLCDQYVNNRLHFCIQLPTDTAADSLVAFVIAYIEHVPSMLEATRSITTQASIEEYTEPLFALAEEYFLKPPEVVAGHIGLEELMDEAYLAHRLMEEVNDRFMAHASIPLVPVNMSNANVIVHSLIGEPFANKLDEAVRYTINHAMIKEYVYDSDKFNAYVARHQQERKNWPCLMDNLAIHLQLIYN